MIIDGADLKSCIVHHNIRTMANIRMMAKYYTKIRLHRMCNLLALPEKKTEDCLMDTCKNKTLDFSRLVAIHVIL